MRQEIICLNSDTVNRYNIAVQIEAFEKSLKELFQNGMPMLVSHDFHRPIGWHIPFSIFIEAGLSRFLSCGLSATENDELKKIEQKMLHHLYTKYAQDFDMHEKQFVPLLKGKSTVKQTRISNGCVGLIDPDIALKLFPSIFDQVDKDGLTYLPELLKHFSYLGQGIFKHKASDLAIFAHPYFRRSQSRINNFHFFFLDELMQLKDNLDITIRIKIDKDMVGFAPSFRLSGEFQYHYGPKYTDNLDKIPSQITRHICTEDEKFFSEVDSTEFFWKKDKHERTLEIEELRAYASPISQLYHCRYIHSIYDSNRQTFIHFDGAMRSYDKDAMDKRAASTFVQFGKKAVYEKLFRIDGKLPLEKWKTLINQYYQDNPLIYEYFGVKDEVLRLQPPEVKLSPIQKVLPFDIQKSEGLKVLVSYLPIHEKFSTVDRYLDIPDTMSNDEETICCIEYTIYEVKKVLQSLGKDLVIPEEWALLSFNDRYWNIPSIMHGGANAQNDLMMTIKALQMIFENMTQKNIDWDISLTLGFIFNKRIIRISSYGHVTHQLKWLREQFPIPFSEEGLTSWVKTQRKYLGQFKPYISTSLMNHIVSPDGVLYIRRIPLEIEWQLKDTNKGLGYQLDFGEGDENLESLQLYNEGKIRPVVCFKVNEAVWTRTGENYFTSEKSRLTTDDSISLTDAEPMALYWTKGKA